MKRLQYSFSPFLILLFLCIIPAFISCSAKQKSIVVSPEAQHRTKVWILERHQHIEHPLISELFNRTIERLSPGIESLKPHYTLKSQTRLYVIHSKEISTFSLCDGSIFITDSTISALPSAEHFMALIAHEIAHIIRNDACEISNNEEDELNKEVAADSLGAKILYASYIDPEITLQTLSLSYRNFKSDDSIKLNEAIDIRKKELESIVKRLPRINTKIPEERVFRKVKYLLYRNVE